MLVITPIQEGLLVITPVREISNRWLVITPVREIRNRWLVITPIREEVLEREQAFVRARGAVALRVQPLACRVRDHGLVRVRVRVGVRTKVRVRIRVRVRVSYS